MLSWRTGSRSSRLVQRHGCRSKGSRRRNVCHSETCPGRSGAHCSETEGYVIPANYNSSVQTVIAGDRDAVEKAAAACAALKARAVPLAVASAFHTKLMQPAADTFYKAIQDVKFSAPAVPFYSNVLGAVRTDFSDMPKALAEHIVSPVRFTDELAAMQAAGIDTFVEFGPKSVLTGLVKKTLKGVTAKNVENCETLEGVLA
ncbi:MAG: ACP S-malonyltransferase [Ruminococcus sp.]